MPDDTQFLEVYIDSPDDSERIYLKATSMERTQSNNLVVQPIKQVVGDVRGRDLDVRVENIDITGRIQNAQSDTYPSGYVNIDTSGPPDGYTVATEKDMTLAELFKFWGIDSNGNLATLNWGPRTFSGLMSKHTSEQVGDDAAGQYGFTIEWTYLSATI